MSDVITLKVMTLPTDEDPADLFLNHDNASELWERAVREARPAVSWRIDRLSIMYDLDQVKDKVNAANAMLESLLHCSPIERTEYVRELADKLGVREQDLRATLNEQFLELKEVELRPESKPQRITLDKYGEAVAFPCPQCGTHRTHFALKAMRCWNCDEWRTITSLKALQRQVDAGWTARIKTFEATQHKPPTETNGLIDLSGV